MGQVTIRIGCLRSDKMTSEGQGGLIPKGALVLGASSCPGVEAEGGLGSRESPHGHSKDTLNISGCWTSGYPLSTGSGWPVLGPHHRAEDSGVQVSRGGHRGTGPLYGRQGK